MTDIQTSPDGRLRHLLTLDGLGVETINRILERAQRYVARPGEAVVRTRGLAGRTVANLFFEASTRTRASFELAARRSGADVLNLDMERSSATKGESLLDTIYTLQAMNVDAFIVRHADAGIPEYVARHVMDHVAVLNAGEGHLSHPTQGLLDTLTIRQAKGRIEGLTIAIIGDIRHSRVARSATQALNALGAGEIRLSGPATLLPEMGEIAHARIVPDMDTALADADVVMMLRIQKERINGLDIPDEREYFRGFGLSEERLRTAKPDAIVMHPGPMNRGVEIDTRLADGPRSWITRQVNNGVAIRMAVLEMVMEARHGAA